MIRAFAPVPAIVVGLACFVFFLSQPAAAVRRGDEQFEGDADGVFVVPADLVISFVDPATSKVVKNITEFNGTALLGPDGKTPRQWGDAVYAENPAADRYYVFINEVDEYTDDDGSTYSYVTVIDSVQREIVARVRGPSRLVHGYSVFQNNEYWAHSDGDGTFVVISLDAAGKLLGQPVKAFFNETGHGKLLFDPRLFPTVYSTNVNQQYVFEINANTRTLVRSYSFNNQLRNSSECLGTHSIGYSPLNNHLYIECIAGGGVLEWDVETKKLVKQWDNVAGAVYSTHDAKSQYVIVSDSEGNQVYVLQPAGPGKPSILRYTVPVAGNPGHPVFYPNVGNGTAVNATSFSQYLVFFPLTNIVNKANIEAVAKLPNAPPDGVTDAAYPSKPFDCKYAPPTSPDTPLTLAKGPGATPRCGSCAPQDPATDFLPNLSGFRYIDVANIIKTASGNQTANAGKLIPAGALLPAPAEGNTSNQCAYAGEGSREGARGGHFIAVFAHVPAPLLYIVDAEAKPPKVVATVPIGSNAARTSWAPIRTYASGRTPDKTIVGGGVAPVSGGPAPAVDLEASQASAQDANPPARAPASAASSAASRAAVNVCLAMISAAIPLILL